MSENEVPLKEYLEAQIEGVRCESVQKFKSVHDAISKAEDQLNRRLEAMNEFRDALKDQTAQLVTRSEYSSGHKSVEEKLRQLELDKANFEGRAAIVASLVSVAVSIVTGVVIFVVTRYVIK